VEVLIFAKIVDISRKITATIQVNKILIIRVSIVIVSGSWLWAKLAV